jgi:hypothetical protein
MELLTLNDSQVTERDTPETQNLEKTSSSALGIPVLGQLVNCPSRDLGKA